MNALAARVLLGRQGIFTAQRELHGYELLFRAPGRMGLRVDLWNARQQDRATEHVIAAAFHSGPGTTGGLPAFINFTRSFLLDNGHVFCPPHAVVIEVVESAFADDQLRHRLAELRQAGYRVAIDDFIGTRSQVQLLEHADFVKIDYRDLTARGAGLATLARSHPCQLIAERVETMSALSECIDLGFDLFQGHVFEPAIVVDRGVHHHRDDAMDGNLLPA